MCTDISEHREGRPTFTVILRIKPTAYTMRPSGNTHTPRAVLVITLCLLSSWKTRAFVVRNENTFRRDGISLLLSGPTDLQDPANMRLREIQSELKKRKVSFDDCFDRDSLTKRLMEARESTSSNSESEKGESEQISSDASSDLFDREATMTELRTQRIKSLREQLSQYNVRWGNMIEKEELVKALCDTLEDRFLRSKNFSRSGQVLVGEVCDATEDALVKELGWLDSDLNRGVITPVSAGSNPNTYAPLLLDVYATW